MAMDKDDMKTKIKDAHFSRTGNLMAEGDFNAIVDICQGIIEEMIANAEVEVEVTVIGGSSAGTHSGTGSITA